MVRLKKTDLDWSLLEPKKQLVQKLSAYVGNQLHSDMVFYIKNEQIEVPAHKLIVGINSKVLYTMIHGTGTIKPSNKITVENISVEQFQEVLNYIYSNTANLQESNCLAIMGVAHYLGLMHLEELCSDFLIQKLSVTNACGFYEKVYIYENKFTKKCEEVIAANACDLIKNEHLITMNKDALEVIIQLELALNDEKSLFEALLKMATNTCEQNGLIPTPENKRCILKDLIKFVRFAAMSAEEFSKCLSIDPHFLTGAEVHQIMLAISLKDASVSTFSNVPRIFIPKYKVATLCLNDRTGRGAHSSSATSTLSFTISVKIFELDLFGSTGTTITKVINNQYASLSYTTKYCKGTDLTKVKLNEPIYLKANESAKLCIDSGRSYYTGGITWDVNEVKGFQEIWSRLARVYYIPQ